VEDEVDSLLSDEKQVVGEVKEEEVEYHKKYHHPSHHLMG